MKLKIIREQFINNPCPSLTKDMFDWLYDTLWVSWMRTEQYYQMKQSGDLKINSIAIRVNQAYMGCSNIHFYISINGGEEFHKVYPYGSRGGYIKIDRNYSKYHRYDWMVNFMNIGDHDFGTTKPLKRYEMRWKALDLKRKSKEIVKRLRREWEQYLRLTEKFSY